MRKAPGLLVALDYPSVEQAFDMAGRLATEVAGYKVGLELLMGTEHDPIERIASLGLPVFADAKLHDIPATVEAAAFQLARRGARWVTVHTSGGSEMLRAAIAGLQRGSDQTGRVCGALGVTVLTSLSDADLDATGVQTPVTSQVTRLVTNTASLGLEGYICAVPEVGTVKALAPPSIAVTPGIRASGSPTHDQKRVATVADAVDAGADLLVVGRAITSSQDPALAAAEMRVEIEALCQV